MARLMLCLLVLLVPGGLTDPVKKTLNKVAGVDVVQRQLDLFRLYLNPHEPNYVESCRTIIGTFRLEDNIKQFKNESAVTMFIEMLEHKWILPKAVPFNVHVSVHKFEASTLFHVLFSAKDYETFYKTAVYVREHVNEYLFSYVLTVVIYHRKDTQGVFVPHFYEIFPSFLYNGEIMSTAQRIGSHGFKHIDYYPSTYKWDDNVVIKWNTTIWPYAYGSESVLPIFYFTHDYGLNAFYYNLHIARPTWLGGDVVTLSKDKRGELFWFIHKQILTRYYMERLSNNLGEIPDLGTEVVQHGYSSGLLYHNGVPFPIRPNHLHLEQPEFVDVMQKIHDYELRIRDAIEKGYIVDHVGGHINISDAEAIDILGRIVEANVDSPNANYYKDFISLWKKVLGTSIHHEYNYHHFVPLVVPSVLEHYQTALRDPAFYMISKRVLDIFQLWFDNLPHYKRKELALPGVVIDKVDVDKLVTYFEHAYVNVTNHLYSNQDKAKGESEQVSVLVQQPRLNHKSFQVRVHVKTEVAKKVVVRFFLAPKYDSHGHEIPLHINSKNFFLFDEFIYELPAGGCVIVRDSNDNENVGKDWSSSYKVFENAQKAFHGEAPFVIDQIEDLIKFPQRLILPKGRVGGMPFVLMVYVSEYHEPVLPYGTGFDPTTSFGAGTGAHYITKQPLGYPVDRPLYDWQIQGLQNLVLKDVVIHHKHTPEILFPKVW